MGTHEQAFATERFPVPANEENGCRYAVFTVVPNTILQYEKESQWDFT